MVSLNICNASCKTFTDLSIKICVLNKTEEVNLNVFDKIKWKNESKTLIKHFSCSYRCKCDDKKHNSNQECYNEKCQCEFKKTIKHRVCKDDYVWNPRTYACEIDKYLKFIDDLVINVMKL